VKMASPDTLVASAAQGLTRRRLFRNAGGLALGASVATAYLGTRPDVAQACTYSSVCGPSPLCGGFRCRDLYPSHCQAGRADTRWRKYNTYTCGTDSDINCWRVCVSGRKWECCDCAGLNTGGCGSTVSGCGSSGWRSCICHAVIGSC
jgi:hypothetical protein